jgi:hypothetical protein
MATSQEGPSLSARRRQIASMLAFDSHLAAKHAIFA